MKGGNKMDKQEEKLIGYKAISAYCLVYTAIVSFIALIFAVIGISRLVLAGILFSVIIVFFHLIAYLLDIKKLKEKQNETK